MAMLCAQCYVLCMQYDIYTSDWVCTHTIQLDMHHLQGQTKSVLPIIRTYSTVSTGRLYMR